MSPFDPVFMFPAGLAALVAGTLGIAALLRAVRARRRANRRIVEKPNSHYSSHLVQETEAKHRWHDIDLDRVHEINRAEVVRLLAKLEATSFDALNAREKTFLDHMSKLAGRPAAEPTTAGKPTAPPSPPRRPHGIPGPESVVEP